MMGTRILFCPAHYVFDPAAGSEISWTYGLCDRLARQFLGSAVVTGFSKLVEEPPYRVVQLQPSKKLIDLATGNAVRFALQYAVSTSRMVWGGGYDVIHHVLPFSLDYTFNLAAITGVIGNRPFVIGPIQSKIGFVDVDFAKEGVPGQLGRKKSVLLDGLVKMAYPLLAYLSRSTLRRADAVIVISAAAQEMVLARGVAPDRVYIIPPGIDASKFVFSPFEHKASDRFELLAVGHLLKRKGLDTILLSMVKLPRNVFLRIVGDGPQKQSLIKQAYELNIADRVIFEGFVAHNKISHFYQQAHIFISGSRAESWGQMYIEAMACGLPVITTENVGSREIVRDGETGILVPQEDVDSLAAAIRKLLNDRPLAARMGQAGRRVVEDEYDWDKAIIPRYIALYQSLSEHKS
jgi:glycosyltransferase involved in cell wall biosynthesis